MGPPQCVLFAQLLLVAWACWGSAAAAAAVAEQRGRAVTDPPQRVAKILSADDVRMHFTSFEQRLGDGRRATTTLVILHHDVDGDADGGAVPSPSSSISAFVGQLESTLQSARPLRRGTPFVEAVVLNTANRAAFQAFKQTVVSAQHHLRGMCVECSAPSPASRQILALTDGKLFGVYPDAQELLSCQCSCGDGFWCPDHPCCTVSANGAYVADHDRLLRVAWPIGPICPCQQQPRRSFVRVSGPGV